MLPPLPELAAAQWDGQAKCRHRGGLEVMELLVWMVVARITESGKSYERTNNILHEAAEEYKCSIFERYGEDFTRGSMCITNSAGNFYGTAC